MAAAVPFIMPILGALIGGMMSKDKDKDPQPMVVERAPAAASQENTQAASQNAALQQQRRNTGASGRSDTVKTDATSQLGGGEQQKTLLGY